MAASRLRFSAGPLRILLLLFAVMIAPLARAQEKAGALALPHSQAWKGDFDAMLKRRIVRLLVPFSETQFFLDRGRQMGIAAEFGERLEEWLNARHAKATPNRHLRLKVVMVPLPRANLLPALEAGFGDAVLANLTITPERLEKVDFTAPWMTGVRENIVTGPAAPALASLDDLAGKAVPLRPSSSYASHLAALSEKQVAAGKPGITLQALPESLEDEKILDMVQAGLLPFTIVDDHKARLWAKVYPKLKLREDLAVHEGGEIAWAIRKGSPLLKAELDAFLAQHREGTGFGNTLRRRYFGGQHAARSATAPGEIARFDALATSFRKHGEAVKIEPLLLAAQGYQESHLIQSRRSPRGAVGIMQLLPSTAAAPPVSIHNVASDPDANILAGARYMRHLMDLYVNDPALDPLNRTLMTFAAYNAGPGNLRKFRRKAREMGLDANLWSNNVEHAAARVVGRETVQYVSNIYKYYVAYDLARRGGLTASGQAR